MREENWVWELIEETIEGASEKIRRCKSWRETNKKLFLLFLVPLAAYCVDYYVKHKLSIPKCESNYSGTVCSKDINNDGKKDDWWVHDYWWGGIGIKKRREIRFYYSTGENEIIFKEGDLFFKITSTYDDKGRPANETLSVLEKIKANNYCWRVIGRTTFEYKKHKCELFETTYEYRLKRETIENYVVQMVNKNDLEVVYDYYKDISPSIDDQKEVYKVARLPFCSKSHLPETLEKIMFVKTVREYDTEGMVDRTTTISKYSIPMHSIKKRYFDLDADGLIDISYEIDDGAIEKVKGGHYYDEKNFELGKLIIDCAGYVENYHDIQCVGKNDVEYNISLFLEKSCTVEERNKNNALMKKVKDVEDNYYYGYLYLISLPEYYK
jgi:hypothetical protein